MSMDMYEVAKGIEKEGMEFYTKLAEDAPLQEARGVFEFLAREEQRHYNIFSDMQQQKPPALAKEKNVLWYARESFDKIAKPFKEFEPMEDFETAYAKALELEKKSIDYYTQILEKAQSPQDKEVLTFILGQEKQHAALMENLLEFTRRPKLWLENAEWNHLEKY
mgnify:CR=1 FL=1